MVRKTLDLVRRALARLLVLAGEVVRCRHDERIANAYRTAYAGGEALGDDFAGWENEGVWSDE